MDEKLRTMTNSGQRKSTLKSFEKLEPLDEEAGELKEHASPFFKTGDSVVVKKGVHVPDCEDVDISGWRGRIREIDHGCDDEPSLLGIEWDSITLKHMPRSFIEESEKANLMWTELYLYDTSVLPILPRDDQGDVVKTVAETREIYALDRFLNDIDPLGAPTYDYLGSRDLNEPGDLEEIVDFLPDGMRNYFLKWDAVMREEQGAPLLAKHKKILTELIRYGSYEDGPILYINHMARPHEPWYETIRKIAAALVMETFDTSELHYPAATEGWPEIVDCLEEYGKSLMLPEGAASPIDVVPKYIRSRLFLQCCLGELDELGQTYAPGEERVISLEDGDAEGRIDSFIDALRDNKESLEYLDLTLEKLYEILTLPPGDEEILTRALCKELGMPSRKTPISDFM